MTEDVAKPVACDGGGGGGYKTIIFYSSVKHQVKKGGGAGGDGGTWGHTMLLTKDCNKCIMTEQNSKLSCVA